jgi:hypothetical protein
VKPTTSTNNYPVQNNPTPTQTNPTAPTQPPSFNYSDTEESKVVSEESGALLVGFEKKSDGYWYLSFDYLRYIEGQGTVNENPKIRTFRADANLKIYQENNRLNNPNNYKTIDQYLPLLIRDGDHYINSQGLSCESECGTPDGHYIVNIRNGKVITLDELFVGEVQG